MTKTSPSSEWWQSNNISGPIPSDLGNLTSPDIYLHNSSGPIPESLGRLTKLQFLRLNNNSLSGTIPMFLTNFTALQVLDLSNNNLGGPVPFNSSVSLFTPISVTSGGSSASSTGAFAGGVAAGSALLFAAPAIGFAQWHLQKPQEHFFDVPAEEDLEVHLGQLKGFSLRELQVATDTLATKIFWVEVGLASYTRGGLQMVHWWRLRERRKNPWRGALVPN